MEVSCPVKFKWRVFRQAGTQYLHQSKKTSRAHSSCRFRAIRGDSAHPWRRHNSGSHRSRCGIRCFAGKSRETPGGNPGGHAQGARHSHGFSDCLVLVSEQEARLVTVITLLDANGSHKTLQRKFTTSQETVGALRGSLVANAKTRSISCHAVVTPFQKRLSGIARY